jgi:SAM-dependent methyltransferase
MLYDALSHIDLYCTACRILKGEPVQHRLELIAGEIQGGFVITGYLECPNCGKQYPVLDGVPRFVEGLRSSEELVSQYLEAHYSDINTGYWVEMEQFQPGSLHLDMGCGTGRFTFECAREGFAVGMDANLDYIKSAAAFQREGVITYRRKTRTLAEIDETPDFQPSRNVLFILADILDPPFRMEAFDSISGLNVIDSVKYPLHLLGQADAMLAPGGRLFLSSPYCWDEKENEPLLESEDIEPHEFIVQILTGRQAPELGLDYRVLLEKNGIPWRLRKRGSLEFNYSVDMIIAQKAGNKPA